MRGHSLPILTIALATTLSAAASAENLPRSARPTQPGAAPTAPPSYDRPPEVIRRCSGALVNGMSRHVMASSTDGAYGSIGGGVLARGPIGDDERHVFLYLPNLEVRVDAETGACTPLPNGRTVRIALEQSLDRAMNAYKVRVAAIVEGERSEDERDRTEARRSRERLAEFEDYLKRTFDTCTGNGFAREVPEWIQIKFRAARVELRRQNGILGPAPGTRNGPTSETPATN